MKFMPKAQRVLPGLRVAATAVALSGALAQPAGAFFCFNFSFGSGPRPAWGAGPGYARWPGQTPIGAWGAPMWGAPIAHGPYNGPGFQGQVNQGQANSAPAHPAAPPWGWAVGQPAVYWRPGYPQPLIQPHWGPPRW